ncbi:MAG: glycerate kinase type-2 family protein [Pyrinomonadaceae bacterium]
MQKAAREIFDSALHAADAGRAMRRTVVLEGSILRVCDTAFDIQSRQVYVVAIGKAAPTMAVTLREILGDSIATGVISGPPFSGTEALRSGRWRVFSGGHPLPNQDSLEAARATFDLLRRADEEQALVVFLVSGGGSAMMEWPRDEKITLSDLEAANRALISCGASIAEINAVRRAFSAVKGGRLADLASRANQVTLILSDTNRGDESSVASGPTLHPPADDPRARDIINHYGLNSSFPASILGVIDDDCTEPSSGREDPKRYVILDNQVAIEAAASKAQQLGFTVEVASEINEQPISQGCEQLISRLLSLRGKVHSGDPVCVISGGEFSCPVRGNGIGGRNSETALRCAIQFDEFRRRREFAYQRLIALSSGTDGQDGNSPAAGAVADETTVSRALAHSLNAEDFLARSDSFTFFEMLGEAVHTGTTGTNVRDLRILIAAGTNFSLLSQIKATTNLD